MSSDLTNELLQTSVLFFVCVFGRLPYNRSRQTERTKLLLIVDVLMIYCISKIFLYQTLLYLSLSESLSTKKKDSFAEEKRFVNWNFIQYILLTRRDFIQSKREDLQLQIDFRCYDGLTKHHKIIEQQRFIIIRGQTHNRPFFIKKSSE